MADVKISALPAAASVTADDLVPIVNDPGGVPVTQKATAQQVATYVISADATLAALAAYNTNGLLTQTAADTFAGRTITGTADRLSVSNGDGVAGNPTLDIAATYVGQASITTLGTIATGVWQGTVVGPTYGGTGVNNGSNALTVPATGTAALLGTANAFTAAQSIAIDDAVTNAVTVLKTFKHTSSGTPAASFGSELLFQLESTTTADQDAAAMDVIWTTATHASRTSAILFKTVNSGAALAETLRIAPLTVTVTGHVYPNANNTRDLGSTSLRWKDVWVAGATTVRTLTSVMSQATDIAIIAKAFTAQSANIQEWRDVSDNVLSTISENGYFTTRKVAAPADAELSASEMAIWFDATNGAAKLMIKAKSADGTVVTGNVALA